MRKVVIGATYRLICVIIQIATLQQNKNTCERSVYKDIGEQISELLHFLQYKEWTRF